MWLVTALLLTAAPDATAPVAQSPLVERRARLVEERPSLALPVGLMVSSGFVLTVSLGELALFLPLTGGRLPVLLIGLAGGGVALALAVVGAALLARAMWGRDHIDLELESLDRPKSWDEAKASAMITLARF